MSNPNPRSPQCRDVRGRQCEARSPSRLIGVVVVVALVGAVVWALLSAIAPQRGPEQVVRQFVQATFNDRDAAAAGALLCTGAQIDDLQSWQQDLVDRETRYTTGPIRANVTAYADSGTSGRIDATVDIAVTVTSSGRAEQRLTRPYRFTLARRHGWKICAATPGD